METERGYKHEQTPAEQFLKNPAFQRFSRQFDVYQQCLKESDKPNEQQKIRTRMWGLYQPRLDRQPEPGFEDIKPALNQILIDALKAAESGKYSIQQLAENITASPGAEFLKRTWEPKLTGVTDPETGVTYINETLGYMQENPETLSIELRPTTASAAQTLSLVREGLASLAKEIQVGKISVEHVIMESWLLGREMGRAVQKVLGDSKIEPAADSEQVTVAQNFALQYNDRALQDYLKTGHKPEVGSVTFTSQEFVKRFG